MVRLALLGCCAGLMVMVGGAIEMKAMANSVNQVEKQPTSAIELALGEASELIEEGSKKSLQAAITQLEIALRLSRLENNDARQALSLFLLGHVSRKLGETKKALEFYNQSLPLFKKVGHMGSIAIALNSTGVIYHDLGEPKKALELYNQALSIRRSENDSKSEAVTLNNMGLVYSDLGETQKALEFYNQALPLRRKAKDKEGEAVTLNNIGTAYFLLGETQKALNFFNQSLPIRRDIRDRAGEAITLNNIAGVYSRLGKNEKALNLHTQALTIYRTIGDRSGEADTLNQMGSFYFGSGKIQKALEFYNQALPISKSVGQPSGIASTLNRISSVYSYLGDYEKSLELNTQSLKIYREIGDRSGEASRLHSIASIYSELRKYNKALKFYNQALQIRRSIGDLSGEASTLNGIGSIHSDLGEHNKAIEFLTKALSLKRSVQDLGGEAKVLNDIALVYSKLREYKKSLDFYNQALSLARSDGNRAGEAVALSNIGFLFQTQNQINPAISFYKQSISIYEALRDDIKSLSRSEQSLYTQKISDTYRILANLLIKENRLTEAQHVLELLKIREIQENQINRSKNQTSIRQLPVSIIEKQEISKINPKIAQDIKIEPLPEPDRLSPTNPLNQSAQSLLNAKPNSALIYHLITKDNLWIILAAPDGKLQKFSSNANQQEIESLATNVRDQIEKCEKKYEVCDKNDTQTLNQTTQTLYQRLFPVDLQAALTQAKTQHLTLALDGSLRNIPIAALHTGSQYLIEQYSLSTIIAAQLTDSQDKLDRDPSRSPVLAVGTSKPTILSVPDFVNNEKEDRFSALGNTPAEVNTIVNPNAFPGSIFLDNTFTLANLQQNLPNARLFHIASHGIFRPNFLDYSYILMGNNQRWSIAQMDSDPNAKLFQNIHMVTLSACQTGLSGRDKTGMEIAGMSHAFMSKGAKSVTASLWQVEDASTAMFMQHYYRNLTTQPKSEALRTAQLKLLRTPRATLVSQLGVSLSDEIKRSPTWGITLKSTAPSPDKPKIPDYTHPYYWAPFILIGNSL